VAGPRRVRAVAPTVAQRRRTSHFEGDFTTIRLYFSQKWSAISLTVPPVTTTLVPVAAIPATT